MEVYIDKINGGVTPSPSSLTYSITVPDNFDMSKTIEVQEGEKQKTNEQGQPLYYKYVEVSNEIDNYVQSSRDETTESRTITKTIDKKVVNKWADEDGEEHSEEVIVKEPIEWVDNEPVMTPNIVSKVITFSDNPYKFTGEEVLKEKYRSLLDKSQCDNVILDIFLSEDDLDLEDSNHAANTGVGILELLPKGQAKTKPITLESPAKEFYVLDIDKGNGVELYLNGQKFVEGKVSLSNLVDSCTIRFSNTTDKPKKVKLYAIGY